MTVLLRSYQTDMVNGFRAAYASGHRRILGQLPTGGGKGRLLAHMARAVADKHKRILIVAHRSELVDQICANLDAEDVPYGRVQPGWPMLGFPVLVGMVQTVARRVAKLPVPDLFMVDESHHAPAGQYHAMFGAWPTARVIGVTATPVRTDGQGLSEFFDVMVQGPSVRELIDAGHLADYDYFLPSPDFSVAAIGIERGDYNQGQALRAMSKAKIVGDAVAHYNRHLRSKPAIAFCMGVAHTHSVAEQFMAAGITAAAIDGTMPLAERKSRLQSLASGAIQVLTAADVISEGVDIPQVAGAILLRPTCSEGLYLQQVGRALRPKQDGSRAIILDHVGNARKHGMPADPRMWSLAGKMKSDAPEIRTCDKCMRVFPASSAREIALNECVLAKNDDEECPIVAVTKSNCRGTGSTIDGELEVVSDPWAWAGGIDPVRAYGAEWHDLVERASTEEHLAMIARARGYKRGWTAHVLRSRRERVAA